MKQGQPLDGKRVLVVEDNFILAMDVCHWLEAAGAKVVGPAPDAEEARELLSHQDVDGAVVDINLGQGPTYEIAHNLEERGVPFLFTTGYDRSAIPTVFGSAPRLEKPFRGADLVRAVLGLK
jgi:CheY-like chemotaxis protein